MKKSKFSGHQVLSMLKQHEAGIPVTELAREHGIHSPDLSVACQIWRDGRLHDEGKKGTAC